MLAWVRWGEVEVVPPPEESHTIGARRLIDLPRPACCSVLLTTLDTPPSSLSSPPCSSSCSSPPSSGCSRAAGPRPAGVAGGDDEVRAAARRAAAARLGEHEVLADRHLRGADRLGEPVGPAGERELGGAGHHTVLAGLHLVPHGGPGEGLCCRPAVPRAGAAARFAGVVFHRGGLPLHGHFSLVRLVPPPP